MRRFRNLLILALMVLATQALLANDYTLEELDALKKAGVISAEDYQILKDELLLGSALKENIYSLKMGAKTISKDFMVIIEEGRKYLDLMNFLSSIQFTNYTIEDGNMELLLGELLDKVVISGGKITFNGEEIGKDVPYSRYLVRDGKFYIESEIFQEIFLSYYREDNQTLEISIGLSFTPPVAIDRLLDISAEKLARKDETNEIIYTGERELFNLGYLRVEAGNTWSKTEEESKYKSDWDGSLSYQGGLLYGEFQFDYDVKEKEFSNFRLDYNEIWKGHTLEIGKSNFDSDGTWSFHFYKEKGFYDLGDTIIITERVPVGSRVELLYMGTPIAIQDEEGGMVVFSNSNIRTNRDYQLKIYTPDGKITLKDIRTSEDYNRQQKGEIEYDLSLNEEEGGSGYNTSANFYYGLSDKFTVGLGYNREVGDSEGDGKKYLSNLTGELTYGNAYNGYSYTLQLNGEYSLDSFKDKDGKDLSDKNQWGYLAEVTKNKWRVKYDETNYGSYHPDKNDRNFEVSYDLLESINLDYSYSETTPRGEGSKDKSSSLGVTYDKNIGGVLVTTSADFDLEDEKNNEYSLNAYYSGFKKFTTRLENTWTNNGEDYEVALNVYNNNLGGFLDVSAEVRYSNIEKETFGLTFSMTLDSWFTFDVDGDEHGNNNVRVGFDRIIDLKNPSLEVDNMDVSRAEIITFVDNNNNNMYDKGEPRVSGVEVTLGSHKVVTDENGSAKLYNLSNGILYELQPKIKKPSYTMGNNIIKLQSKFSSDVDVYIPIKPMMNLAGYINIDRSLGIDPKDRDEFYSNIIVQIVDMQGKEIDLASPDNTGYFDISGLFPEEYLIKVYYIGNDYNILNLNEKIVLKYDENNGFDFDIQFNITNEQIEMLDRQNLAKIEEERVAQLKEKEGVRE